MICCTSHSCRNGQHFGSDFSLFVVFPALLCMDALHRYEVMHTSPLFYREEQENAIHLGFYSSVLLFMYKVFPQIVVFIKATSKRITQSSRLSR